MTCPQCATQIAPALLSCPACHALVHTIELNQFAAQAEQSAGQGDLSSALASWRRALELLPPDSRQYQVILEKVAALSRQVDAAPGGGSAPKQTPERSKPRWARWTAALGPVGLLAWKFKFVLAFLVTKGKLLLVGLTQASTFFSMLLSLGLYWTQWGWKFAVGLVISIYIHEMGHVEALRRYGIRATAPMFIPMLGRGGAHETIPG